MPIQAVTMDPETGALLPVGGSHIDPVTRLPVAIEVGSMMVDPVSGLPVPILAVTLDDKTGTFSVFKVFVSFIILCIQVAT